MFSRDVRQVVDRYSEMACQMLDVGDFTDRAALDQDLIRADIEFAASTLCCLEQGYRQDTAQAFEFVDQVRPVAVAMPFTASSGIVEAGGGEAFGRIRRPRRSLFRGRKRPLYAHATAPHRKRH